VALSVTEGKLVIKFYSEGAAQDAPADPQVCYFADRNHFEMGLKSLNDVASSLKVSLTLSSPTLGISISSRYAIRQS